MKWKSDLKASAGGNKKIKNDPDISCACTNSPKETSLFCFQAYPKKKEKKRLI